MAAAQILQLYYTKNNKSLQGNQAKYFHHQRIKLPQQERVPISIPFQHFQTLSEVQPNNISKATENISFQSKVNNNKITKISKGTTTKTTTKTKTTKTTKTLETNKVNNPVICEQQTQKHHESLFSKTFDKSATKKRNTTTSVEHPSCSFTTANVDCNKKVYEYYDNSNNNNNHKNNKNNKQTTNDTITTTSHCSKYFKKCSCSKQQPIVSCQLSKNDKCQCQDASKDDANRIALTFMSLDDCQNSLVAYPRDQCGHNHNNKNNNNNKNRRRAKSAESTTTRTKNERTNAMLLPSNNNFNLDRNNIIIDNDNNHFQYKKTRLQHNPLWLSTNKLSSSSSSSSTNFFSKTNIESKNSNNDLTPKHYTPTLPERINVFNTGIYKQSKADKSVIAKLYWQLSSKASNASEKTSKEQQKQEEFDRNYNNQTTSFDKFYAIDEPRGEKKYAFNKTNTTKTATTTTTSQTKNCAKCCQHNVSSKVVATKNIDDTCLLEKQIGTRIFMKGTDTIDDDAERCLICKCQNSNSISSICCENCYPNQATLLPKHEENNVDDDEHLQSSKNVVSSRFCSSAFNLQSQTQSQSQPQSLSKQTTTTLTQLSSKKQQLQQQQQQQQIPKLQQKKCNKQNSELLQHENFRLQRTSKTQNFNCPQCHSREWTPSKQNNKHGYAHNNIDTSLLSSNTNTTTTTTTHYFNTKSSSFVGGKMKLCRQFGGCTMRAFADIKTLVRAILPLIIIFNILPHLYAECDQTFVSRGGGPQNGTFSAPLVHNPKNHSRQCLYIFLAGPGQRVELIFTTFNLRGSPPDGSAVGELPTCVHEYMDIYSEVQSSDPADLINSPFGGRFCGTIPPRRRISMHRAIAISFFTNKNVSEPDLFEGRYRFLNASEYEIGIPIAGSPCSYTITPSMSLNKTGVLISPTYPGAYPKDMSCTYQFLGETNQRVRLEFRDFDLFFGGPHCPFDYIKVYDGPDNSSALIGTYCGQQRNLVLYSSESSLFVHFYTLPRTANTQNRGFKGIYEFSESFVKLDFIRENDGIHIRGTECDQKILSKKESTGFVLSPNYPYPYIPKTVCRYFVYGMQDAQHLERVRLEFSSFNIPKVENKDKGETNCSDGYLKIYLKGQETADAYDKFDYELCGNETQKVVSDGPRLAMVFSSGELQGRGFKGKYTFETEYKIPGTAAPDGTCSFTYVSSSKKRGDLNSPRYPSNYPSETNCSYLFLAEPNEQVTIVFDHFKVKADNVNSTAGAYGASACFEDWLEIYVIYRDNNDRFLGRYCGLTAPGPVESPRGAVGLRITLHTDQENVASGFKARYFFETTKSDIGDCGGNFSNQDSGIITSPNYPHNYKSPAKGLASMACNWYMTARAGYKLSINFEHFSVEGDPMARGCPAAVLRMWTNIDSEAAPIELCGEKTSKEHWHYISTGQAARISFTTTDKTIGAQGFRIVWTEIQDSGPGPPSIGLLCESDNHFQCNIGYCISEKLRCDGIKNCGPGDDSDEMHCESYHGSSQRGSRHSNNTKHGRRLVPNLSPMHTLSSPKKTPEPTRTTSKYRTL